MSNKKLKAIIIDDEILNVEALDKILSINCKDVLVVARCVNPVEAVDIVLQLEPDIVFLDINMPELNGFDFLNQFKEISFKTVFTTAYGEYALKAIKYAAFDFILKPINSEEVVDAVNKVRASSLIQKATSIVQNNQNTTNLALPTSEGFSFIDINEIIYCKSDNSYTDFVLKDGKRIVVSRGLKDTEGILEKHSFFRIHQSYLVNSKCIKKFNKHNSSLLVSNGEEIPVSVRRKDDFLQFVAKL